jgi:polar amino acid transport system permease protein
VELLWSVRGVLLEATINTALLFVLSSVLAMLLSLLVGIARISRNRWLSWAALVFGETFRGISLVVQLFWLFFVLPLFGITLSATTAAVIALGICFGAYGSEIVRTSLLAVPKGQREAARALGLSPARTFLLVELPQALLIMLPPMGNLLVLILKSTSVTALITVQELAFTANALNANHGATLAVFGYVLAVYYLMSRVVLWGTRSVEARFSRGRIADQRVVA